MQYVKDFLDPELKQFHRISKDARTLIATILLWQLASPFLSVFTHAFLWRETQSLVSVATYSMAYFSAMPVGFIIAGYLLRYFTLSHIYGVSMLVQGAVVLLLMVFSPSSLIAISILGVCFGAAAGFFWGARNMLELLLTTDHNRNYFFGTLISLGSLVQVVVPFLIGITITSPYLQRVFSPEAIYILLAIATFLLLVAVFFLAQTFSYDYKKAIPLTVKNPSPAWKHVRLLSFFDGIAVGRHFYIPTLMVLFLVGDESVLGVFQSLSAIILAAVMYVLGKHMSERSRLRVMGIGAVMYMCVSAIFAVMFSSAGVIVYRTIYPIALGLLWITVVPIRMHAIEQIAKDKKRVRFSLLSDNEVWLNMGRIVGIAIFLMLAVQISEGFALQFTPFITSIYMIGSYYFAEKVVQGV